MPCALERDYREALRRDPCPFCGAQGNGSFDHVEPIDRGGPDDLETNIVGICRRCNGAKRARSLLGFLLLRREQSELDPVIAASKERRRAYEGIGL